MENNIREQIIADTVEYDKKLHIKKKKINRITGVFTAVLVLLFVYFGFFNTKYELLTQETEEGSVEYGIRVVDSTTFFVKIPAQYQGKDITFLTSDNECGLFLFGMYIPDGIKHIGVWYDERGGWFSSGSDVTDSPFLMYVRLPNGLEEIHKYAFRGNSWLRWVQFPKQVEDAIIGEKAFRGTAISSLVLPEGFTTIDRYAFANCDRLRKVYMPDSLVNIGSAAFEECGHLKEVRISDNAKYLSNYMFNCCSKLKTIKCSDALEYIGVHGLTSNRLETTNISENLYYKGGHFGYDAIDLEKENSVISNKTGIPIEVLETELSFTNIWIEGQYYELPMEKEEFLAMDTWSILDSSESEDKEVIMLSLRHDITERTLRIKMDKNNYVKQLLIDDKNNCYVVVPGGTVPNYSLPVRFLVQSFADDAWHYQCSMFDFYDNRIVEKRSISFGEKYECKITSLDHYTGVIDGMIISVAEE